MNPPTDHVVLCKKLKDECLHTFKGMVGYCMKNNEEQHFEFIHHNIFADDMNEGKLEYAKFRKIGLNNHMCLFHSIFFYKGHINGLDSI